MLNGTATDAAAPTDRYLQPGWFTRNVFNRFMQGLTRIGVSLRGSQQLAVRGRTTGQWRTVPVNPLDLEGERFLVAPRGQTQWVRNVRAGGDTELRLGRKVERVHPVEVADADKPEILREYVKRWKAEVGQFFDGIDASSSDTELLAIASGFPVFRLT